LLNNFVNKNGIQKTDGKINSIDKEKIEKSTDKKMQPLEFGIQLKFSSREKENLLRTLLKNNHFDPSRYIVSLNNNTFLLDYRIFGMLYNEINSQIFDRFNGPLNHEEEEHAKWLKREAEEFYFNYSIDELLAKVALFTIKESTDKNEMRQFYLLCPKSANHNNFVHRICYTDILNLSLDVKDRLGYPLQVKDGKRVVHFCKLPLHKALEIYNSII